jgi:hypothetical protein
MDRNSKIRRNSKTCKLIVKDNQGPVELVFETDSELQSVTVQDNIGQVRLIFKKSQTIDIKEVLKNIMWSLVKHCSKSIIFWLITTTTTITYYS